MESHATSILTPFAFSKLQELVLAAHYASFPMEDVFLVRHHTKLEGGRSVYWVPRDGIITYSCHQFEFFGILCRHALRVLSTGNCFQIPERHKVVIVEGNYLLLEDGAWKEISTMFDEKCVGEALKTLKKNRSKDKQVWVAEKGILKQKENCECGYFVMRYMKDIIEGHNFVTLDSKMVFNFKNEYNVGH